MNTPILETIALHYYWPTLSLILIMLITVMLTILWLHKPKSPAENDATKPGANFNDLYNRIHNYQQENTPKKATAFSTTHNNASTDSTYHHAIKLLQRGMDTKTLVEYCNLTQGEAELLQAVYGKGSH